MINYAKMVKDGMNITQGRNQYPTHVGANAYDEASKDTGRSILYAPCPLKCVNFIYIAGAYYSIYETKYAITLRNGKKTRIQMMLLHGFGIDNIGKTYETGEPFYDEGTMGNATGNHVHMEFGYDYNYDYPLKQNESGTWIFNARPLNIEDIFYLPKCYKTYNTQGYNFLYTEDL